MKKLLMVAFMALMVVTTKAQVTVPVYKAELSFFNKTTANWEVAETNYPKNMRLTVDDRGIVINAEEPLEIRLFKSYDKAYEKGYNYIRFDGYEINRERQVEVYIATYDNGRKIINVFSKSGNLSICFAYHVE